MGIKNFFVRSESIKNGLNGLAVYLRYLEDSKHKNHLKTNNIYALLNNADYFFSSVARDFNKACVEVAANKKGGRPPTVTAQSFCLSMPASIQPTRQEWVEISKSVLKEVSRIIDVDYKVLVKHTFINVHDQNNSHLNILIPRRINGKSYAVELSRPSTTNVLKSIFNGLVYKIYGLDRNYYKPEMIGRTNGKLQSIKEEKNSILIIERNIKKLSEQIDKYVNALLLNDMNQYRRQRNRMQRTVEQLKEYDFMSDVRDVLSIYNKIIEDECIGNSRKNRKRTGPKP
ncbi:hypothetical protein GCM10011352_39170 [Marinobacterium zhoushanense]|uniref:Uncharacterized protein n=1 Tax=Marinobacterium zhoushanense TaxID=1679163 RepID=A0ABQ1KWZ1_9GAMM|nr:hypothetical protein [Marinobacterium zhoushanense]GGC08970.1 hypothetical protein GCM10011352_39170 [Marinobacterium zhoushanense]